MENKSWRSGKDRMNIWSKEIWGIFVDKFPIKLSLNDLIKAG